MDWNFRRCASPRRRSKRGKSSVIDVMSDYGGDGDDGLLHKIIIVKQEAKLE